MRAFCSEKYYTGIASDPSLKTKLCGSWSTLIGENDTYIHILEHEASYAGYDEFLVGLRGRQVGGDWGGRPLDGV